MANVRWISHNAPTSAEQLNEIMRLALEGGEQWVQFVLGSQRLNAGILVIISFN